MSDIPRNWSWETFKEIGTWTGGGTPSKRNQSYWQGGDIPWVSPKDMKVREISETEDYVTEEAVQKSSAKRISTGSVLFVTRSGILEHTLPTALTQVEVTVNQDLKALTSDARVDPSFLLYYTQSEGASILRTCSKDGTTVASLESSRLYAYPVPVPPLAEQRRIVQKIEELFSDLDAGIADLKKAQRQLRRYRQSVLHAAARGRLTDGWRAAHPDTEPAETLLARILEERRAQWEADYRAKYEAKGKEPPSGWKKRYTEPEPLDTEDLPALPAGWVWTSIEQISTVYGGVTKNARKGGDLAELPYLRVANVYADELRLEEIKKIKVKKQRVYKYLLEEGDLLVVEGNGSKSQIGRVAQWDGSIKPCVHQNHLIKVRPAIREVGAYVLQWLLSSSGRAHITDVASSTSGLYTLSLTKVRSIPVPLPSLAEQSKIVDEVERLLSLADGAAQTVERELKRAERLRQSILKRAFSGRLVPQSSDDASATNGAGPDPNAGIADERQLEMRLE